MDWLIRLLNGSGLRFIDMSGQVFMFLNGGKGLHFIKKINILANERKNDDLIGWEPTLRMLPHHHQRIRSHQPEPPGFTEICVRHPEQALGVILPGVDEPPGRGEIAGRVFRVVGSQDHGVPAHGFCGVEVLVRVPQVDGRRTLAEPHQGDDRDGFHICEQVGQGFRVAMLVGGCHPQAAGVRQVTHDPHLHTGRDRPTGHDAHAVKSPPQAVCFI